jgi:hypothetical protein
VRIVGANVSLAGATSAKNATLSNATFVIVLLVPIAWKTVSIVGRIGRCANYAIIMVQMLATPIEGLMILSD